MRWYFNFNMTKKQKKLTLPELEQSVREWVKTQDREYTEMEIAGIIFQTVLVADNIDTNRKHWKGKETQNDRL